MPEAFFENPGQVLAWKADNRRGNCYLRSMATRFVDIDRDSALLLPPDLRDWVPANHLVHFVIDAVEKLDLRKVTVNTRGTGDAQYPPSMLLALLTYSYATGVFGSRRIEQLKLEVDELLAKAEQADATPLQDGLIRINSIGGAHEIHETHEINTFRAQKHGDSIPPSGEGVRESNSRRNCLVFVCFVCFVGSSSASLRLRPQLNRLPPPDSAANMRHEELHRSG